MSPEPNAPLQFKPLPMVELSEFSEELQEVQLASVDGEKAVVAAPAFEKLTVMFRCDLDLVFWI